MAAAAAEAEPGARAAAELTGVVTELFVQGADFCAGRVRTPQGAVQRFRAEAFVQVGELLTMAGEWADDPKYGRQFAAAAVAYAPPSDPATLVAWLRAYGRGIGPVKARRLVDAFGMDLPRLMADDPELVAAGCGLPAEAVREAAETWHKKAGEAAAVGGLIAAGLTRLQAELAYAAWGDRTLDVLRHDPYAAMGRVDGVGWAKADAMAKKFGVAGDDPRRVAGAVAAAVRESRDEGSTAVHRDAACESAAQKLGLPLGSGGEAAGAVEAALAAGRLRAAGDWLAAPSAWNCERAVWGALAGARGPNPHADYPDPAAVAAKYAEGEAAGRPYRLDAGQLRAVELALSHKIVAVTGGAGAGKTVVMRAIAKAFDDGDVRVMLAAPTGKAARRMEEVSGREAKTIHRLLGYREGEFAHGADNPLPPGVVLVDEASMIDAGLMAVLLDAVGPETSLVLIGDPHQLPPVGPGSPFRDAIANGLAPVARLEGCHRQAGVLKANCAALLAGRVEPSAEDGGGWAWVVSGRADTPEKAVRVVENLYREHLPRWGIDPVRRAQFLTAKNDGPLGTRRLNLVLRRAHQATLGVELPEPGDGDWRERPQLLRGDKVINAKNNYELNVMNGAIGEVLSASPLVVDFGDAGVREFDPASRRHVTLAYCVTPHKFQGSETDCAVVVVPKMHDFMHHRNWLYTAATRARRTCVIVGDDASIRRAAERVTADGRSTLLQVWACGGEGAGRG